ncbi:hypothetical protein BBF96_13295 [Anoxybacter fermentans]|uniref:PrcB C-terminal domain-containing protein n=1 Tax=Anoxybacter fermentans TaxID=1323375 RepID=A0A3Q9HRS7_9FIRM|nr:protease complex subunit PrcB family protein [Anoxybacter fermentans]AZR74291.1 hypothetical protein BBF96_13295 [Anoxybacter fermentans]
MEKIEFSEVKEVEQLKVEDYKCMKEDGQWMLILARGECRTAGYDIFLKEVTIDEGVLTAIVSYKDPDPAGFTAMVITYPTRKYILKLEKEPQKVIFKDENGDILKVIHN